MWSEWPSVEAEWSVGCHWLLGGLQADRRAGYKPPYDMACECGFAGRPHTAQCFVTAYCMLVREACDGYGKLRCGYL